MLLIFNEASVLFIIVVYFSLFHRLFSFFLSSPRFSIMNFMSVVVRRENHFFFLKWKMIWKRKKNVLKLKLRIWTAINRSNGMFVW